MSGPTEIPSLDELVRDPLAGELAPATLATLVARAAGVQAALQARLAAVLSNGHSNGAEAATAGRTLTVEEAAAFVPCSPRWFLEHCRKLSFVKGLTRKTIRIDEAGLREWIKSRRP